MVKVKKGDFVQIQYTGKLEDGTAFDTTSKKEAEKQDIYNPDAKFGPVVICIGENHIIKGFDSQLEGKDIGDVYNLEIPPEEGFGKKDAKLIQMIATNKFTRENINPMPGLQVNVDGMMGIIKNVSGGRTLVDFNHPLSGQKLFYEVRIDRVIDDDISKVKALLELKLGVKDCDIEIKQGKAIIMTEKDLGIPEEIAKRMSEEVSKLVPAVKDLEFTAKKEENRRREESPEKPEKGTEEQ